MIHVIYIYLIINAFLIGYVFEDNIKEYVIWKMIFVIIGVIFLLLPLFIVAASYEYLKLCIDHSSLGNFIYVMKVKYGKEVVTEEILEIINKSVDKKKLKAKKTFSDKVYIWGAKHINETYLKNF